MRNQSHPFLVATIFAIAFLFHSCSKKPGGTGLPPATTFKFTFNGTVYQWDGNLADNPASGSRLARTSYNGATWYDLAAMPANSGLYTLINLKINSPSLSSTTYTLTTTSTVAWTSANHYCGVPSGLICASSEVGDYATVIITSIHDGYADGTFSAHLTNTDGSLAKVDVTGGEFHNVKIVQ